MILLFLPSLWDAGEHVYMEQNMPDNNYDATLEEIKKFLEQLSVTKKTISEIASTDQFLEDCIGEGVNKWIDPLDVTLKRAGAVLDFYGKDEEISQKFLKDEDYHVEIVFVLDEINNAYLLVFWRAVISSGGSLNFPLLFTRCSSDEYVFALPDGSGFSKIWFEKLTPLKNE